MFITNYKKTNSQIFLTVIMIRMKRVKKKNSLNLKLIDYRHLSNLLCRSSRKISTKYIFILFTFCCLRAKIIA